MHLSDFVCASLGQCYIPGLREQKKIIRLFNLICKICFFWQNVANFSIFVAKFGDFCGKIWQNLGFQMAIFHDARLYKKCNERPFSTNIAERCWCLFSQILHRNDRVPASKAIQLCFYCSGKIFRGRPTTTLPVTINKNLSHTQGRCTLKPTNDLNQPRSLA